MFSDTERRRLKQKWIKFQVEHDPQIASFVKQLQKERFKEWLDQTFYREFVIDSAIKQHKKR